MKKNLPVSKKFVNRLPSAFRTLAEFEDQMDQWMRNPWGSTEVEALDFSPLCEVKENKKEFIVKFDVPGIKKEDMKVELENNRLTVSGERKEEKEEKDLKQYISESFYGSFYRSLNFPVNVDADKVDASYEDGVLTIKVPKIEASKSKEVKVH